MLMGEYSHTLDTKKRLALPAKFRPILGKKVVITRGLDQCLFVYAPAAWKQLITAFSTQSLGSEESRAFKRFMLAGACEVDVDTAGRILLPDYLKSFAGLQGAITLAGVGDRIELWDTARWHAYTKQIEGSATKLASTLAAQGKL